MERQFGVLYKLDLNEAGKILQKGKKPQRRVEDENKQLAAINQKKAFSCKAKPNLSLIHERLEHTSLSKMKHLEFCDCKDLNECLCDICCVAKHHSCLFILVLQLQATCLI